MLAALMPTLVSCKERGREAGVDPNCRSRRLGRDPYLKMLLKLDWQNLRHLGRWAVPVGAWSGDGVVDGVNDQGPVVVGRLLSEKTRRI